MRRSRLLVSMLLVPILWSTMGVSPAQAHVTPSKPVKVLIMGGSAAIGWGDTHDIGGYIGRAFQTLNNEGGSFIVDNASHEGLTVPDGEPKLKTYIDQYHPEVVLLAYGLLNDIATNVSDAQLEESLKRQIQYAIDHGSQVFVVTSVLTMGDGDTFERFTEDERKVALAMGNQGVHLVDLNTQMKMYIEEHNINLQSISADGWHPNAQGHALAGKLLADDLLPYLNKGISVRLAQSTTTKA